MLDNHPVSEPDHRPGNHLQRIHRTINDCELLSFVRPPLPEDFDKLRHNGLIQIAARCDCRCEVLQHPTQVRKECTVRHTRGEIQGEQTPPVQRLPIPGGTCLCVCNLCAAPPIRMYCTGTGKQSPSRTDRRRRQAQLGRDAADRRQLRARLKYTITYRPAHRCSHAT